MDGREPFVAGLHAGVAHFAVVDFGSLRRGLSLLVATVDARAPFSATRGRLTAKGPALGPRSTSQGHALVPLLGRDDSLFPSAKGARSMSVPRFCRAQRLVRLSVRLVTRRAHALLGLPPRPTALPPSKFRSNCTNTGNPLYFDVTLHLH